MKDCKSIVLNGEIYLLQSDVERESEAEWFLSQETIWKGAGLQLVSGAVILFATHSEYEMSPKIEKDEREFDLERLVKAEIALSIKDGDSDPDFEESAQLFERLAARFRRAAKRLARNRKG